MTVVVGRDPWMVVTGVGVMTNVGVVTGVGGRDRCGDVTGVGDMTCGVSGVGT